ncbi:MAG: TlpA disulfide reductase family protein [Leptospiraceae bacterium]|nr:TlpA disulfide reductase family protein [Leptospiraceae bacterium]
MKNQFDRYIIGVSFCLVLILFGYFIFNFKREINEPYHELVLGDWNGKEVKLGNFKGKILVLDFWATWCEPCKKAAPVVDFLRSKFNPESVLFLGVNTDKDKSIKELKAVAQEFGMQYESILDPDLRLADLLQVEGQPALLIFDRRGKLVYRQYGLVANDATVLYKKISEWEK